MWTPLPDGFVREIWSERHGIFEWHPTLGLARQDAHSRDRQTHGPFSQYHQEVPARGRSGTEVQDTAPVQQTGSLCGLAIGVAVVADAQAAQRAPQPQADA